MNDPVPDRDRELESVRELLGRAEYLGAFDAARRALELDPDWPELEHLGVLALARAGATSHAERRLAESRLLHRLDGLPDALAEDVLALEARLAKDRALAGPLGQRPELAMVAAELYEAIFGRYRRTYTGVNAATMWAAAGDDRRARAIAGEVVALLADDGDYWSAVTRAEALLLLDEVGGAEDALAAANRSGGDLAARATTRRQLELVCGLRGVDVSLLAALRVPAVVHFCGHLPHTYGRGEGRLAGDDERRVASEIAAFVRSRGAVIGYGSLAAGADVLVAEAILAAGGELNVVLPFAADAFEHTSVAIGGERWIPRFHDCLAAAGSVTSVSSRGVDDDDAAFAYCSSIAMGSAVVRAQFMTSRAEQLAIWDGEPTTRLGGTAADVTRWRRTGLPSTTIRVASTAATQSKSAAQSHRRQIRAMLFSDLTGFSSLGDHQVPRFVEAVLRPLASVIDEHPVVHRNGWGDALFVVFDDVAASAEAALRLQDVIATIDTESLGLPPTSLRVGLHAGPVHQLTDPVRGEPSYFGEHVTLTARIEPVTPPGAVFVTDAFAAVVALECPGRFICEYVGRVPMAKSFGTIPMYLLRRTASNARGVA